MIIAFIILCLILIYVPQYARKFIFNNSDSYASEFRAEQRRIALRTAQVFLNPYKNIWRNLRLSNKYCILTLGNDGVTIKCIEKLQPYRKLEIISSKLHTSEELWNTFCIYFSYNKSYDGVKEDCYRYGITIKETINNVTETTSEHNVQKINTNDKSNAKISKEKLDINNCSEIELTELPGISIVLAKKTIKRREEIGGFKSVEEFLNYIKLKPHMENQLKTLIKTDKMKGFLHQKKYKERSVDL